MTSEMDDRVIIDLTVKNFRSFKEEQMLSMLAESGLSRHRDNLSFIEEGKLAVLRSAVIVGANASGKSNILKAVHALKWIVARSGSTDEDSAIPPYEPYKLNAENGAMPVEFQVEFVVPSGTRYRYEISFHRNRIVTESLYSFNKRQRALVFLREPDDGWDKVKFGATYKGGIRRISFFPNQSYLSKAGSDASAPESIREVARYFRSIIVVDVVSHLANFSLYEDRELLEVVSSILGSIDTGIVEITSAENPLIGELTFPAEMPDVLKDAFINANKLSFEFWSQCENGEKVSFDDDEISAGTRKLFELLPVVIAGLQRGSPVFIDELDGHLHTSIVSFLMDIFNDSETNPKGSQLIFTTHDTNILDPNRIRRDQICLVSKQGGASALQALDEFDKKFVRPDSPFEKFYLDGRLGAVPSVDRWAIRRIISEGHMSEIKKAREL